MFIFLGTRNGKEMVLVVERDEEVHFIKVQIMEQVRGVKREAPIEDNTSGEIISVPTPAKLQTFRKAVKAFEEAIKTEDTVALTGHKLVYAVYSIILPKPT